MINRKFVFQTKQLRAFQLLQTEIASQLPEEFFERLKTVSLIFFSIGYSPIWQFIKMASCSNNIGNLAHLCDHTDKDIRSEIWSNGSADKELRKLIWTHEDSI